MGSKARTKIYPHLWYDREAEEAASMYAAIFPDSRVDQVWTLMSESPSGPAGSVKVVDFTLLGQRFQAFSGGPHDPFNKAISLSILCRDQAEVDRLWDALTADGGQPIQCSWLTDKFTIRLIVRPEVVFVKLTVAE